MPCQYTIYGIHFPIGRNAIETEGGGLNGLPRAHREKLCLSKNMVDYFWCNSCTPRKNEY